MFFSKGPARALKRDKKKDLKEPELEHFMSGTSRMLPSEFNYQPPSKAERIHQAEKPIKLLEEIIELVSYQEEFGLDQFAGSAVAGEAALNTNRNMILIESDSETFDKGRKRLAKLKDKSEDRFM